MAITTRIPSHITDSEIRTRIAELETITDEDNPFDPWWSVDALESELQDRAADGPYYSGDPEEENDK